MTKQGYKLHLLRQDNPVINQIFTLHDTGQISYENALERLSLYLVKNNLKLQEELEKMLHSHVGSPIVMSQN